MEDIILENPNQPENPIVEVDDEQAAINPEGSATLEEDESGDDSAAQPKKAKGVQKRIDELTRLREEARRDAEYWRELAMRHNQPPKPEQPEPNEQPATPAAAKPQVDQYSSYEEYIEALTDWKMERARAEEQKKVQEAQSKAEQEKQSQTRQQAIQSFQERVNTYRSEAQDFDAVVYNPAVPISESMMEVILDSDIGPKIAYHLGKNPAEAQRIAGLTPTATARELGRIEARLSLPAPKKTTTAPDPIRPIGGNETHQKAPQDMSFEEYRAWRAKR